MRTSFKIPVWKNHSHKKQSLETRVVLTEIFMLCWNLPSGPKHRGWLQKSIEGNKLFAGDFVLIWMKQTLIWFNLQSDGTKNGLSNIKETFSESLQLQMSVLNQRMNIFQSSMLVSQVHMTAGQNVAKKKVYTWCVRSQSKCWNKKRLQTQVYII